MLSPATLHDAARNGFISFSCFSFQFQCIFTVSLDLPPGDVAAVVRLIGAGGGQDAVKSRDKHNRTPLHLAAWAGHVDTVKVLLSFECVG
jgi:ankyrin repeat protein